jgi:hypothetical protein
LVDPPRSQQAQAVDPALLTLVYYLPIVNAIRARQYETARILDDVPYLRTHFEDIDTYLSLRADIVNLVSLDQEVASRDARDLKATNASLYDLVLSLDAESADTEVTQWRDDEFFFLGGDGVVVELGQSWRDWLAAESQ